MKRTVSFILAQTLWNKTSHALLPTPPLIIGVTLGKVVSPSLFSPLIYGGNLLPPIRVTISIERSDTNTALGDSYIQGVPNECCILFFTFLFMVDLYAIDLKVY